MNTKLKNRLLYKRLQLQMEKLEEENFGYSPSSLEYDSLFDRCETVFSSIKINDRDFYFRILDFNPNQSAADLNIW